MPRHVAVIMDGNGRWARRRGLPRIAGHRQGVERVRDLVKACGDHGIPYLTLFAFSSENWRRPEQEVRLLMDLFLTALDREARKLHENNVRFRVIGDIERFGPKIGARIRQAQHLTENNTALTLTIAANYGGRWDIAQAAAELARRALAGEIQPEDITAESFEPFLSLHDSPEPDLFIRTGGEQRISNFLLWQLAYTELYFTPVLWPDFDHAQFELALRSFAGRERRFGMTGEQIDTAKHA
ncbi:MAG: di-trans,poly-cis-decaprenylcistransferase [Gammaproteobacteria bacterium]|nr:di-trans,poly-cis-decaprenylcistransferase [Gammaproteobacteria bacterium]